MKSRKLGANASILACFLLIVFLVPGSLRAQLDTGGITGTITDPTGAVVAGATVTLTNDATGVAIQTKSTSTGTYSFGGIRPGTYTLQGAAQGFETFVDRSVIVHVQEILTIDMHLTTGAVQQQVTVTAAAPLLQAENASVGQVVTGQTVNDLPLQTRDWASLAQLSAGVETAPVGNPSSDSGTTSSAYFVVDGVNLWQNDFRLNGINDNIEIYGGSSVSSNAAITPPPDAIQEFKLQNGNFNAEYGHSTGAVINAEIKSGTNQFHGDVWEYVRNDIFNANLFFNSAAHAPTPEYRQNLYGATIGGPIVKDKLFFFGDYQGGRYITPSTAVQNVPTMTMVNSGFADLQDMLTANTGSATDAEGRVFPHGTVLDPATTRQLPASGVDPVTGLTGTPGAYVRDPFYTNGSIVGIKNFTSLTSYLNVIPSGRIDSNAVELLDLYPAPTASGFVNNYTNLIKSSQNTDTFDIRIDDAISERNSLFGVFDRSLFSRGLPGNLPGLAVGQTDARNDSFPAYAWAVGFTHIFTPTFTNDMHVGMVHSDKLQRSIYGDTFGIPAQFGIAGIQQVANNGGLPPISFSGSGAVLTHLGVGNYTPTLQYVWSLEGVDNVTKLYRNHDFKMGIQIDDLEGNISQPPQGRGNFTFSGQYTDIPNQTTNLTSFADMLITPIASTLPPGDGAVSGDVGGLSSFGGSNISATDDHRWYWGAYFQDDWKATPNLTLNLGLRWDYFTPYLEIHGNQANFIPAGGNGTPGIYYMSKTGCAAARSAAFNALLASSNITIDCLSNGTLGNAQATNLAPRLGFADRLTPTLVLRGGYGIAYGALGNLGYGGTLGTNYPFVYTVTFNAPNSYQPLVVNGTQTATLETALSDTNLQDPTVSPGTGLNLYGRQFDFQTPYVQEFNLTIQEQFTNHDAFQVGYVGTLGRHLDNLGTNNDPTEILPTSANPQNYVPYPSFARGNTYETTNAESSYNSLQTTYEHQLSAGLALLGNYTYSKCMSNQHTEASQNQPYRAQWLPGFGITPEYALCDTDATHLFHISGTYDLPFGHGREFLSNASRPVDTLLGGWVVNFIFTHQSGQPFTVTCPVSTTADFGCFANVVPGANIYAGPHNYTQWLNPAAFAEPPAAQSIGQTDYSPLGGGQQQARGPGLTDLDSSVFKNFAITERFRFQFRAEAFNTTNTPEFGQPGSLNFTSTKGFSSITSERGSPGSNRTLQLAGKLFF